MAVRAWTGAAVAAAVWLAAGTAHAAAQGPAPTALDEVTRAGKLVEAERCAEALPVVAAVKAAPGFAAESQEVRFNAARVELLCALGRQDWAAANTVAAGMTDEFGGPPVIWRMRYLSAVFADRFADAVTALEVLLRDPGERAELDDEVVFQIYPRLSGQANTAVRRRYLAAIYKTDYRPKSAFAAVDGLWADYALMLAEAGERPAAEAVAARIEDPDALLQLMVDRQFAADAAARPSAFDPWRAAEAALVSHRRAMALEPDKLEGPVAVGRDLGVLGRWGEALPLYEAAEARIAEARRSRAKPYDDLKDQENWLRNAHAWALSDLGRFDEAVAVMRAAAKLEEQGSANVSQIINLSELLVATGRPQEAITVLAGFDGDKRQASPYGLMWMWSSRACAFAQLGRAAELDKALAWLKAHPDDNPAALSRALLCAGDIEAAAASYIRRLEDPEQRQGALLALSRFRLGAEPAYRQVLRARLDQVRARPDVQAAAAKAGAIGEFAVFQTYYGDI